MADDPLIKPTSSDVAHGNRGGGPLHTTATPDRAGFMSAEDKSQLDELAALAPLTELTDPGDDRLLFWDDSAGGIAFLEAGTSLTIADVTLNLADGDKGDLTVSSSGENWDINAGSVTTEKVNDNAITNAKLAQMAEATIKGRATSGTGSPEDLTPAQARSAIQLASTDTPQFTGIELGNASDTTLARVSAGVVSIEGRRIVTATAASQGDILYWNGTFWTRLSAGTSGRFLRTNGTGANPTWATSGGFSLVGTAFAGTGVSGTTYTDIAKIYSEIHIWFTVGSNSSSDREVQIALSSDNGSTFGANYTLTGLEKSFFASGFVRITNAATASTNKTIFIRTGLITDDGTVQETYGATETESVITGQIDAINILKGTNPDADMSIISYMFGVV